MKQAWSGAPGSPLILLTIHLLLERQLFKAAAFLFLSESEITHSQYI